MQPKKGQKLDKEIISNSFPKKKGKNKSYAIGEKIIKLKRTISQNYRKVKNMLHMN